jgi:hypothetical protein
LPLRFGDRVERQSASLGHGGTLPNGCAAPVRAGLNGGERYAAQVEVVISEPARDYIRRHGGTVFVRSHPHRCCTGALTLLDVTTTAPGDASEFESLEAEGVGVRYSAGASGRPAQLTIDLRGILTRRPVAFWDGCAYKP